jgi:hypothetical protein
MELALPRILDEVAARVLCIYHDRWRHGRDWLKRSKVLAKVGLASAIVGVDRGVRLCFRAGELFYGHLVEVELGSDLAVLSVEVEGVPKIS